MKFDAAGSLVVADGLRGLLPISPAGTVTSLVELVHGERMLLPDDVAIGGDGVIWFSDASRRFDLRRYQLNFWECRATGGLLRFDPLTRHVDMALDGLRLVNGLAVRPDDRFVLVTGTMGGCITGLWLKGPRAGQRDSFVAALPGNPDNLTYNGRGTFWVALPGTRSKFMLQLAGWPRLRKALYCLPLPDFEPLQRTCTISFDVEGRVTHNLLGTDSEYDPIANVAEAGGKVYFGSIATRAVGWAPAP